MNRTVACGARARVAVAVLTLFALMSTAAASAADDPCHRAEHLEPQVMQLPGLFDDDEAHRRAVAMAIGPYCVQYWDVVRDSMFGQGGIRVVTVSDGAVREAFWRPVTYLQLWFDDPDDDLEVGEDLTGNGLPNLVIWLITGGDCCLAMLVLEFGDGVRTIYDDIERLREATVERSFRDLTGDGRMELVAADADGARWACLNGAGIDLVRTTVWRYEPTFGDDRRGAYVRADPRHVPEVFEWHLERGHAILAYDGSHPFDPNDGPGMFPRDLQAYHDEHPSDLQRVCALLPLGMALVDAGRYDEARALLPDDGVDLDEWPWSMAVHALALEPLAVAERDPEMLERLTCPTAETPGVVAWFAHGGHAITGWALTTGRDDLLGAVRVDLADGRTWCFARAGGYVTLATGAAAALADLNGSGHPDVLIQVHGLRACEQFAYVVELGPEPRLVFEAASWMPDPSSAYGHAVCPFALEDLNGDGRFELVTTDSYWANPGAVLPSCSHAMAPYVPVAFAYGEGRYRVVDLLDPRERIQASALAELYDGFIGASIRAYARVAAEATDPRFVTEHRCAVAGAVLPWFYLRQPDRARAVFEVLYQLDDREAVWARVVESVGASPYAGGWYP